MAEEKTVIFPITEKMAEKAEGLLVPEAAAALKKGLPITVFGAAVSKSVVGALACVVNGVYFEIVSLYVVPEYRRRRIGQSLIREAERLLEGEELLLTAEYTEVNGEDRTLAPFFEAMGFTRKRDACTAYYLTPADGLNIRLRATEASKYDIRFFSDLPEETLKLLANECRKEEMPIPKEGLLKTGRSFGVISLRGNKAMGFLIPRSAEGEFLDVSSFYSENGDSNELSAMLALVSGKLKEAYPEDVSLLMLSCDEASDSFLRSIIRNPVPVSYTFVLDPEGAL